MTVEEWRGKFVLTEPIEAEWGRTKLPGGIKVVEIACGADAEVWSLAHSPIRRGFSIRQILDRLRGGRSSFSGTGTPPTPGGSILLKHVPEAGWTVDTQIAGQLDTVVVLHDGTVAAGGEGLLEEGGTEATWVSCALFHFEGESWSEINLAASDVFGLFVDGACDADGYGWIVGTHQTHSCMARGNGTEWEPDGCGSWYLYHVHIDRDGHAFALGGDGLWRLHDGVWLEVGGFGRDIGWPVALSSVNGEPWTLDAGSGAVWSTDPVFEVDVYLAGLWARLPLPKGWRPERFGGTFAISENGDVYFGVGNDVWHSTPLSKVDQENSPPRGLTPEGSRTPRR